MKNSKIPARGRPGVMIKSAAARKFEAEFLSQVPSTAKRMLGSKTQPVGVGLKVYYPSWRNDLECALVYDLLGKAGVVTNDRYIRRHFEEAFVDPGVPRVEVTVYLI